MKIHPLLLIKRYYEQNTVAYNVLVTHSEMVTQKALELAGSVPELNPNVAFIEEAAMLHDIGIFLTDAPGIGCKGAAPYIMHGPLGREILEKEGLPGHALVCDRHTGVGLTKEEIEIQELPLPNRDMLPVSLEEKIICLADCFYGKNPKTLRTEKSIDKIEEVCKRFGPQNSKRLAEFRNLFGI